MGSNNAPLAAKAERFCQEYLKDSNGSAACRRAGYSTRNAKGAGIQAARLLKDARVLARLEELRTQLREENALTVTMILEECRRVAGVNMRDFVRDDGTWLQPEEWSREMGAAVSSVDFEFIVVGDKLVQRVSKLRLWSKNDGIQLGMRHLGLLKDELTLKGNPLKELVDYVANKGHGLAVKR